MDERFHSSILAPELQLLGLRLRKFTLWHLTILDAIDSPWLDPKGQIRPSDLLVALRVCSCSWPDRPDLRPRIRDVWRRFVLQRSLAAWKGVAASFAKWMDAHQSGPEFWEDMSRKSGGLTGPEALQLAVGLMRRCNMREAAAWNESPGMAAWMLGAAAELDGAEIRFVNEEELDQMRQQLGPAPEREQLYKEAVAMWGRRIADEWIARWDEEQKQWREGQE